MKTPKFCPAEFFLFMTKKEKTKKLILIIFLLVICLVLIRIYKTPEKQNANSATESKPQAIIPLDKTSGVVVLEIDGTKYEGKIREEMSVYDFMAQLQKEGKITFKEKTYSGMGKFIEEINGVKSNGTKYWIYYINGQKAEVGVSNYKINSGDIVSWKYE